MKRLYAAVGALFTAVALAPAALADAIVPPKSELLLSGASPLHVWLLVIAVVVIVAAIVVIAVVRSKAKRK